MIKRRTFLSGVAASVGVAAAGCNSPSQPPSGSPPPATPAPAAPPQPAKVTQATNVREFMVARGGSKGLFLTFEGLCAIVLPKQAGDPVRVGLLAGHKHVATMKLHRDGVGENDSWQPTASDDEFHLYALKGLHVNLKSQQGTPVQYSFKAVADECSPNDETWNNLGWALDIRNDLGGTGNLKGEWWKDPKLVDAVFELDRGYLEGGFAGDEPVQYGPNVVKWDIDNGRRRVVKQIVRLRLNANAVEIEARTLGTLTNPMSLKLDNNALVYVGVKHFPVGPTEPRYPKGKELKHIDAFASLIDGFGGKLKVPKAADPQYDCNLPSTPDCTCCPPGVYP